MDKKVIYVDFKTASKKSRHANTLSNRELSLVQKKKSFMQKIFEKLKSIVNRLRKNKKLNTDVIHRKHWL